jgi:hypothetical protein
MIMPVSQTPETLCYMSFGDSPLSFFRHTRFEICG